MFQQVKKERKHNFIISSSLLDSSNERMVLPKKKKISFRFHLSVLTTIALLVPKQSSDKEKEKIVLLLPGKEQSEEKQIAKRVMQFDTII